MEDRPEYKRFDLVIEGGRNGFRVCVRGLPNVTARADRYSEVVTRAEAALREVVGARFLLPAASLEA